MSFFELSHYESPESVYVDPFSLFGPETIRDTYATACMEGDEALLDSLIACYPQDYLDQVLDAPEVTL